MLCSNLPLDTDNEEKWSLKMCASSTHSSDNPSFIGYFTLMSLHGCEEDAGIISFDTDTVNEVRRIIGPHEFYTLIEGLETLWLAQEYLGRCVYQFPFRLRLPAPRHRLYLVQTRKDYWGFNEVNPSVFPQVDISVIANQVFFTLPWPISKFFDTVMLPICNGYPYAARFVTTLERFSDVFNNAPLLLPQSELPITNFM